MSTERDYSHLMPPWKPGESGNPLGGSKKQRAKQYLREFLRDELAQPADLAVVQRIVGKMSVDLGSMSKDEALAHMRQLLEDGLSKGQAIAFQLVEDAMGTGRGAAVARSQIIALEPKTITVENQAEPPRSPLFVPSEELQAELEKNVSGDMVH